MKIFAFITLACLTGCFGGSADETLLGPDKDGNGVRDDVDRFIEKSFEGIDNQNAAKQYAKYVTLDMLFNESKKKLEENSDKVTKSSDCYSYLNSGRHYSFKDLLLIVPEIENTKTRVLAARKADETLGGSLIVVKSYGKDGCEFKIQGKKR